MPHSSAFQMPVSHLVIFPLIANKAKLKLMQNINNSMISYDSMIFFVKLANKLGNRMREAYQASGKATLDHVSQSIEVSCKTQVVAFIAIVQQCKRNVKSWEPAHLEIEQTKNQKAESSSEPSHRYLQTNQRSKMSACPAGIPGITPSE